MKKEKCERCGKFNYNYDMVSLTDEYGNDIENICNDCFNEELGHMLMS